MEAKSATAHLDASQAGCSHQAEVHTLPNGLRVVVLEDHSAPVVALQTWVHFGSADEGPAVAGIAHVFEHMLFKGTEKRAVGEIAGLMKRLLRGSSSCLLAVASRALMIAGRVSLGSMASCSMSKTGTIWR